MKKIFSIVVAVGLAMFFVWAGVFYWQNLRGIGPVVKAPSQDIIKLVEQATSTSMLLPPGRNATEMPLKVSDGFTISIFAKGLGKPRVMIYAPNGGLLVSIPASGKVVRVSDANGDGVAEETLTVVSGLNRPHGMATRCETNGVCKLYIAESDKVAIYDYDNEHSRATNKKKIIDLPDGGNHFTRTLMFMPYPNEGKLLISVGSTCNVCNEKDWRRAKVLVANADGTDLKVFASGLRNAVFMAIHPVTGKIWTTEMGRDLLGDVLPPDEINILGEGKNYGWPICYGKNIHDGVFDKNTYIRNPCMEPFEIPSYIDIPAHSAPLGLAFAPEEGWPEEYWYNLFVVEHGSWNRTVPTGYKVVRYKLDAQGNYLGNDSAGSPLGEDFISGWLKDNEALGRPVDILTEPGGIMYISDDKAGAIYRVTHQSPASIYRYKDLVEVTAPREGDVLASPLTVKGRARGTWFFEASFPVRLSDAQGKEIAVGIAQAQSNWMTADFVPFEAKLEFQKPATGTGMLTFHKDNPSGLPEHDDAFQVPIVFDIRQ